MGDDIKSFRKSGKNPILNLISYWKQHGWSKTKEDWYYNFLMLQTPEKLINQEIIGYIGSIAGLLFACFFLYIRGMWFICFALLFGAWLSYVNLKSKLKQKKILKDIENMKYLEEEDKE